MAATSRFGISLKQLRDLMEYRGAEGVQKLNEELGGIKGLIAKLNTSETNGKKSYIIILDRFRNQSFFLIKKELFLAQIEMFNFWKELLNGFFLEMTGLFGLSNYVSFVSVFFIVSKDQTNVLKVVVFNSNWG